MSQPKSAYEVLLAGARAVGAKRKAGTVVVEIQKSDHSNSKDDYKVPKLGESSLGEVQVMEKLKQCVNMLKMSTSAFDPSSVACCWDNGDGGENMLPFIFFCLACNLVSEEGKRRCIKHIACNMLRTAMHCSAKDVLAVLCLSTYKLAPAHEIDASDQLGIGEFCVKESVSEAYGMSKDILEKKLQETGDLGLVAVSGRLAQSLLVKPQPLTVCKVYDTFRHIAEESGKDSRKKKKELVKKLLVAAYDCEPKYLVRLLLPKRGLQIGCAEPTLLEALGQAAVFHDKHNPPTLDEAAQIVRQAYSVVPVFDKIVTELLNGGLRKLQETCRLTPGIPIEPALANSVGSVADIAKKFRDIEYICEHKYDGERGQIHYMEDGRVEIYSRRLERSTEKFPDIVQAASKSKNPHVRSFILDCEIVAYDRGRQTILPFQKLSTRDRKDVQIDDIKIDACIFAFDMLYLNGEPLLSDPLVVRKEHLYASFKEEAGVFQFATTITSDDPAVIHNFFQNALASSFEGLVVKPLIKNAEYEPGKRRWLKLKKDSVEGLWDSLDLVPIGAYYGYGKRAGVYGTFLLACYDSKSGEFQTICKAGSGITDEELDNLFTSLSSKVLSNPLPYYRYDAEATTPDVWFEPSEVWEVKAGGLTVSPKYLAAYGIVDPNKGLSLRNPCMHRFRTDKDPKQATSADQVAEMYGGHGDDDVDD